MSFGDEVDEAPRSDADLAETLAQLIDTACELFKASARGQVPIVHDADALVRLAQKARAQVEHQLLEAIVGHPVDDARAQEDMAHSHHERADKAGAAA